MNYRKYILEKLEKTLPAFENKKREELLEWKAYSHKEQKKIVVFGAGEMGGKCCGYLQSLGIAIDWVCDNDKERQGDFKTEKQNEIPVLPVESLMQENVEILCFMAVGHQHFESIQNQIKKYAISKTVFIWHLDFYLEAMMLIGELGPIGVLDKVNQLLEKFSDEESLKILLCHFEKIFDLDVEEPYKLEFKDVCIRPQYFLDGGKYLQADECMIDCGAFTGDTLDDLIHVVGFSNFSSYYCYELDDTNYEILKENIKKLPDEIKNKIHLNHCAVGTKTEKISYVPNGMASRRSENGKNVAENVALDEQFEEERVTFIKMDIEGSEQVALQGAKKLIIRDKPMCAISSYHNVKDLFEIPNMLKEYVPEYQIILRHHTDVWCDTVCYAKLGEW
ncbi:MAG: FkbM family methyltransferase [Oscillospiraceae bacterium]